MRSLQSSPDLEGGAINERGLPPGSRHDLAGGGCLMERAVSHMGRTVGRDPAEHEQMQRLCQQGEPELQS